jgi:hypothetical protein
MRPKTVTLTLAVDPNGVCQDQTTAGAGNLLLNGALVGSDPQKSTIYTSTTAQQMGLESAANLSGITFTFTGKGYDANSVWNDSISEDVTGPNATTVETSNYFTEISNIAVDGAVGSNVEIGPVDEAISPIIPIDPYNSANTGVQAAVTGTINYSVDHTLTNVLGSSATPDWSDFSADLTNATTTQDGLVSGGMQAVRVVVNSGSDTGAVRFHIAQSD